MSTTYIQALPNVRGRMSYTEHGEGSRRREHLRNGTDRIAAQMGDMPSREEFVEYCESLHGVHPAALNEGYELRVSWATDELKPENPDDVQRGLEHAYTLCHRLAPDSPCWVTMHVDGEGGCVHAHATIANHDCRTGQVVNKGDTSLYAPRVQAVNDVLSRESGLSVLGADKVRSTWAERRDEFASDSFDRRLGDAVQLARNLSDDVDSFKSYLKAYDIELKETTKTDKRTGEVTTGWSYRMRDVWGPKKRMRKRRASNLADDLTREGVERYYAERQAAREAEQEAAEQVPVRPPATEAEPAAPALAVEEAAKPAREAYQVYEPDEGDVSAMAGDLSLAYAKQRRAEGKRTDDETGDRFRRAQADPTDALESLRADVEAARQRFHDTKVEAESIKSACPDFAASMYVYRFIGSRSKDPLNRAMAQMMALMFQEMLRQMAREQVQREREAAEKHLYAARRDMWDAEKALKAEEKHHEDRRSIDVRHIVAEHDDRGLNE